MYFFWSVLWTESYDTVNYLSAIHKIKFLPHNTGICKWINRAITFIHLYAKVLDSLFVKHYLCVHKISEPRTFPSGSHVTSQLLSLKFHTVDFLSDPVSYLKSFNCDIHAIMTQLSLDMPRLVQNENPLSEASSIKLTDLRNWNKGFCVKFFFINIFDTNKLINGGQIAHHAIAFSQNTDEMK